MALTQTLTQLTANVRRFADIGGTNATQRHPDADIYDYLNRAFGSLHRILTEQMPDLRILSSTTVTTASGTATYALPADFDHLISVDLTANGYKVWLLAYEMHERAALTAPAVSNAAPASYRLRGSNIEYLPTPSGIYTSTLWYVPTPSQLTTGAQTYDTINRLDDYIIAYAARFVAVKDKNGELIAFCNSLLKEFREEAQNVGRNRDKNSPPRPVDEMLANRWGRPSRRWR